MLQTALTLLLIAAGQSSAPATCRESQECRQLALDAANRGDFQQFHDLAWRAMQTGRPRDTALMYLLARAQALSGRPHDALVMLQRMTMMGAPPTDAATNEDFARTRELPGWPEFEALITGGTAAPAKTAAAPSSPAAASRPAAAAAPTAATPAASGTRSASVSSAAGTVARFSANRFADAGLAYDAVSRRFVVGDASERKLMVVGVDADHATDMVRAESAGFRDVAALDIDERRGDLWVASTGDDKSALHRLQLVSGRPLRTYAPAASLGRTDLADLAVSHQVRSSRSTLPAVGC